MEYTKTIRIKANAREGYRKKLVSHFLKEKSGSETEPQCYIYNVDKLRDGNEIFLKRPTFLNKGFDFQVRVRGVNFRCGKRGNIISSGNCPRHQDIIDDLKLKKAENQFLFQQLKPLIQKIYHCEDVLPVELSKVIFNRGQSVELILKVLKWLFIEQDITYWNYSGRKKFYNAIMKLWDE